MKKNIYLVITFAVSLVGIVIFFGFPDLDIIILGIGAHRSFLFHSAIIPLVFFLVVLIFRTELIKIILYSICGSFCVAVGLHLFTDVFQKTAIKFPLIGSLVKGTSLDDRLWELGNMLLCLLLAFVLFRQLARIIGRASGNTAGGKP
jgi:hypothetical protein